jgi:hypothetical protein
VSGTGKGMGGHHATVGQSVEWYTPPVVFDALSRGAERALELGLTTRYSGPRLTFDLDPASPPGGLRWIPAARFYAKADDGLSQKWHGRVWLNPPYGAQGVAWLRRMVEHGCGIALVFARTDTAWWHEVVPTATAVCFLKGRLSFVNEDGVPGHFNGGAPSALLAWGEYEAACVACSGLGLTYRCGGPGEVQGSLFGVGTAEFGVGAL